MKTLIVLCCLLITGCAATLLDYDFEGYQNGQPVGGTFKDGDAIGDIIVLAGDEILYIVKTQNALSGQKSLQLEKGTPQEGGCEPFELNCIENFILEFEPEPSPDPMDPVLLSWIGKLENAADKTAIQATISLPGLFLDSILRLDIYRDRLEVWKGPVLKDLFNHSFSNEHRILIRISPGEGTYAVQISGAGIPSPPTNKPACDSDNVFCGTFQTNESDQKPFVIRMEFAKLSTLGSIYRIDDVKNTQPSF
jgi:hypothetical protein